AASRMTDSSGSPELPWTAGSSETGSRHERCSAITKARADADRKGREFLRQADPVLGRVRRHSGFRPRAWMDDLPPRDAFGTLIFQMVGQQLSVAATRTI